MGRARSTAASHGRGGLPVAEPRPFSLPTFNWLHFPETADPRQDPVPGWPLEEVLDGAAAAGFTNVGLDLYMLEGYLAAGGRIDDLGTALRSRGLTCSDVGVLPLGTARAAAAAETLARVASATGARICVAAFVAPAAHGDAVAQLEECTDVLGAAGVRLALEFVAYTGVKRIADAAGLCDAVGWERCGVLVDTWHFFRAGAPWPELRSLGDGRVALVHVNDGQLEPWADPVVEARYRRRALGRGGFPLAEFAAALDAVEYRGPLSIEVLSDDVRRLPPAVGARILLESLREHWPGP